MKIRCELLQKSFDGKKVVNGITIEIRSGEVCGLLGPNGAGKTTTFHMLVGFFEPDTGNVYLDETNITNLPMYKRARKGIGYLSQEPTIFRGLSVQDNLIAILERTIKDKRTLVQKTRNLLEEFGIWGLRKQKAHSLSGGEKRRLEIARVMINEPQIMLLDEPFVGIDPITVSELKRIITMLKNKGIGMLITDHNVRETLSVTDRSYLIYEGKILIEGSAQKLLGDEKARELYLGWDFKM